jgi:hypothetical protein
MFGEPRSAFRPALKDLPRFIATVETAKHRAFVFLDANVLPDNMLVNIASADALHFGVLSSKIHVVWALAAGGTLEDRPRYNKTRCFDPFPFPDCAEAQKQTIRKIADHLDSHRKRQQRLHSALTFTDMYNVLEKLRNSEELTAEDHAIYEMGLIGILRELHDELDAAVFAAYSWSVDITTEQILVNVVALNAQRRAEEAGGLIRWLRPEYQAPNVVGGLQEMFDKPVTVEAPTAARRKQPWPSTLTEQVRAIKDVLRATPNQTPQQIAAAFKPASRIRVQEILDTLTALGQTREVNGSYLL